MKTNEKICSVCKRIVKLPIEWWDSVNACSECVKKAAIELQERNTKSVNENWEEEFFNRLAEILEEHFPKGEKCSYCGNKLPCRSKALVLNSYANIIFKELLQKERHDNEILVNTILDTKKRELKQQKQKIEKEYAKRNL